VGLVFENRDIRAIVELLAAPMAKPTIFDDMPAKFPTSSFSSLLGNISHSKSVSLNS
jgi:hypothetical protein